jgi:superfamily II DNA or RNA helicase
LVEKLYEAWCPAADVRDAANHLRNSGHVDHLVIGEKGARGRVRGRRNESSGFNVRVQFVDPVSYECRCGKARLRACEHIGAFLLAIASRIREEEQTGGQAKVIAKSKEDYSLEVFKFLHDLFPGIGPKRAKAVARVFRTIPDLLGATPAQLRKLPDIGVGMADLLASQLEAYQRLGGTIPTSPPPDSTRTMVPTEHVEWLSDLAEAAGPGPAHIVAGGALPLSGRIVQTQMTSTLCFFRPKDPRDPLLRRAIREIRQNTKGALRISRRHGLFVSDKPHWPAAIGQLEAKGARREIVHLVSLPLAGLVLIYDDKGRKARLITDPPGVEEAYPEALRILEGTEGHEIEHTGQHLVDKQAFPGARETLMDLGALLLRKRLRPVREITEWKADDPADVAPGVPILRPPFELAPFLREPLPTQLKAHVKLRSYQREGVAFIRAANYQCYLGDPPGLGKTLQALAAALYLPGRILVVCPAGARNVWKNEIQQHTTSSAFIFRPPMKDKPKKEKFLVASYDAVLGHLEDIPLDEVEMVILDEAHYVKNKDALRTQAVHGALRKIEKRLLLSGTPVMNRTEEVRKQLEFIHPDEWSNEIWFRSRFVAPLQWGTREVRLAALRRLREYFAGVMLRRRKEDVLNELPPKHTLVQWIDLPEPWRGDYDTEAGLLREHILTHRDTAFGEDYETTRGRVMRLKHLASQGKAQAAEAKAREILSVAGEKVVIFAYYLEHLDTLEKALAEFNPVVIHGGIVDKDREKAVKAFQEDPSVRVFLGQLTAAGTAITLTAARHALFVDLDWNPANHQQASDRIHRIGQTREVFIHQLVANESIEETIVDILQKKSTMTAALLDADEDSPGVLPIQRENQLVARLALEVAMGRPKTREEMEKEMPEEDDFSDLEPTKTM